MKSTKFKPHLCVALLCICSNVFGQNSTQKNNQLDLNNNEIIQTVAVESQKDSIVLVPKYAIINSLDYAGGNQIDSHAIEWANNSKAIGLNYLKDVLKSFYPTIVIEESDIKIGIANYIPNVAKDAYYRYNNTGNAALLSLYQIKYNVNQQADSILDMNVDGPIKYIYNGELLEKVVFHDASNKVLYYYEYVYDKNDQVIKIRNVYPADDYVYQEDIKYHNGKIVERGYMEATLNMSNPYLYRLDSFFYNNQGICKVLRYADLGNNTVELLYSKDIIYTASGNIKSMRYAYVSDYFTSFQYQYYNDLLMTENVFEGSSTDSVNTIQKKYGYDAGLLNAVETSRFQNNKLEKTGLEELSYTTGNMPKTYKLYANYVDSLNAWIPGLYDREIQIFYDESIVKVSTDPTKVSEVLPDELTMYPNPANDAVHIKNNFKEEFLLMIFDVQGRKVLEQTIVSNRDVKIDVSDLSKGLYVVQFGNKGYTHKLIID